ncbi:amiloride-sensitive sodium channel alpha subunit-like protein [Dermatophagoides farinae]|uniref:Amiloride-sensitive sodium channel alpha subunit-like protein n=1 Tax=Dermatophagoides farinae TaxID=6954 RepID=A0A9D4P468_DERFA|nr:degenerin mec-10-like [Dermatophagoides farinae]KAH7643354.1 amiloride-sensitive sodium channel alpha subunit-like protein [Dermatophagoides farinae]
MGTRLTTLGADSGVPGFTRIFSSTGIRKSFWIGVVLIFITLTVRDLIDLIKDYVQYPVTVNVRIADSRVLPFPAITICNLNLVHRSRFCAAKNVEKPEIIENILCAKIGDMLNQCKISNMMEDLMDQGESICGLKKTSSEPGGSNTNRRGPGRRGKRQLKLQDILKTVREVGNAVRGDGQKGSSIIDIYNDFQESVKSMADGSGGPLDETLTQLANFLGFNVSNSLDIIPMLFMKAFTDTTGCRLGSSDVGDILPDNIRLTLKKLTKTFMNRECLFKTPRLIRLFHDTSQKIVKSLNNCTTPWLETLKSSVKKGETPWFFLLDLLSSWLADLAKNRPEEAKLIGHHGTDLIKQCIFAGRTCSPLKDFSHFFYNSYGNCYTYNLHIDHFKVQDSLSGFTGPKFGLEIVLNLETEQYMPTSRESGAKIVIHDSTARADPDQDSVHVAPGLVTYIGVRMVNITRLPHPYPDKCSNVWRDLGLEKWARELNYDAYSTQICLKLCLQRFTIIYCGCWLPSSPPPKQDVPQCNNRKQKEDERCTEEIHQMYYNETINCDCPPRCTELSFEKFVSTGQELQQCSILTTANFGNKNNPNDNSNSDSNNNNNNKAVEIVIDKDDDSNDEDAEMKLDKNNMAKVVIYFQSLSYQEITQYPKYTVTTLLGAIGGILGVYMGFSFLALFEVFDLFGRVFCCIVPSTTTNNNNTRTNQISQS